MSSFATSSLPILAQDQVFGDCQVQKKEIKWWSPIRPGDFAPFVPEDCGQDGNKIRALTLNSLPDIVVRVYGFLISLLLYCLVPVNIYAGLLWVWGGIFEGNVATAKKLLTQAFSGLAVVLFFYLGVFIILSIFEVDTLFTSTSVASFFQ